MSSLNGNIMSYGWWAALVALALANGCGGKSQTPIGSELVDTLGGGWTKRDTVALSLSGSDAITAISYSLQDSVRTTPPVLLVGEANGLRADMVVRFPAVGEVFADGIILRVRDAGEKGGIAITDTAYIVPVSLDTTQPARLILRTIITSFQLGAVATSTPLLINGAIIDPDSWTDDDTVLLAVPLLSLFDGVSVISDGQTSVNLPGAALADDYPILESGVSIMLSAPTADESMVRLVGTGLQNFDAGAAGLEPRLVVTYSATVSHVNNIGETVAAVDTTVTDTLLASSDTYLLTSTGAPPTFGPDRFMVARGRTIRTFVRFDGLTIPGAIDGIDTLWVIKDGEVMDSSVVVHDAVLEVELNSEIDGGGTSYGLDQSQLVAEVLADDFDSDSAGLDSQGPITRFLSFPANELNSSERTTRRFALVDQLNRWLRMPDTNHGLVLRMAQEVWGVESAQIVGMRLLLISSRPPDFAKPANGRLP